MFRVSKHAAFTMLFFYVFALVGPVGIAFAEQDSSASESSYKGRRHHDRASDSDEDDDDGMTTGEIIGGVLGGVVGLVAGLPLGFVGLGAGGAIGFFVGKWLGMKLSDCCEDDDGETFGDRRSENWEDHKDWWRDRGDDVEERWDDHKDWWSDKRDDWEDRWDSDEFPGKYWWKDKWNDAKFWEDDEDEDDPNAPGAADLGVLRSAFMAATEAYQEALKGTDTEAKTAARETYEAAQRAYFAAKAEAHR